MNFEPDWSVYWTAKKAEEELANFKFTGPGVYHNDGDTILALPISRKMDANYWHKKFDPDEVFRFHVYNNRNPVEIFNLVINAPVRTL